MTDPGMATSVLVSVAALVYIALAWLIEKPKYPLERDRDNRKEEPQMGISKAFLAMINRLPLKGQRLAWVDFNRGGYTEEEEADGRVVLDAPLEEANVMTSLIDLAAVTDLPMVGAQHTVGRDDVVLHRPVIDIDHRVAVVESSTAGHSHLFVDLMMPWDDVVKLLDVMAEIGLVEPGYVSASKARGYTAVRLPWVSKSQLSDEEVRGA